MDQLKIFFFESGPILNSDSDQIWAKNQMKTSVEYLAGKTPDKDLQVYQELAPENLHASRKIVDLTAVASSPFML